MLRGLGAMRRFLFASLPTDDLGLLAHSLSLVAQPSARLPWVPVSLRFNSDKSGTKRIALAEFRTKVMRVLSTPAYAENARRCSENQRAYGGAREAARLVQDYVAATPAGSRR